MFPAVSVAVQVTAVVPSANLVPEVWSQVTTGWPVTRSVAVATKEAGAPAASTASVTGATRCSDGGVVSTTRISPVPVATLPAWSVAVQVIVVVPTGKTTPDAGEQLGATGPSTSSTADAR